MAASKGQLRPFLNEIHKAANYIMEHVEKRHLISVVSHMDADGISAAGIMGTSLARMGATFRVRIERWFDNKVAETIASEKNALTILTDMGSGYLDILNDKMKGKPLIILDHHQPNGEAIKDFVHVNPQLFGFNSSRDISGSGMAYLTAKALSEENMDLACLGVVGALGDMQDKNKERSLGGANQIVVEDAVKSGKMETVIDLIFFGRETRPIHKALAYTTTPFIPGISGEEDKSLDFLMRLGIKLKINEKWRALRDLSQEEKRQIFSSLSDYLLSKGLKSDVAMSLLGTVYILTNEEPWTPLRDAREFALLLNSTGRTGKPGLGVAICMGDRGRCLEEANKALDEYRQAISEILRWIDDHPDWLEERKNIYVFHGGETVDEKMISAVSTILMTNVPNMNKPVIAYAVIPEEGILKISARTVDELTFKGFNIGEVMRVSAEKFNGTGGGHDIAAGAQVPMKFREEFLKTIDDLVEDNIKRLAKNGG
ncbi:MAG: DHH family phosphoesterase [Candidatus Bathyarchaeia archaeon]